PSPSLPCLSLLFFLTLRRPPRPALFPYTTLFRSWPRSGCGGQSLCRRGRPDPEAGYPRELVGDRHLRRSRWWRSPTSSRGYPARSEEHTSELQSLTNLVCRLLL